MAYTKFHSAWHNDPLTDTPITAAGLDWIEAGIASAAATADQAHTDVVAVSAGVVAVSAQVVTNTSDIAAISAHTAVPSVIPALLLNPSSSNAFWTVTTLPGWGPGHWEFLKDVDGVIFGQVLVPAGVANANMRFVIAANATAGVSRLGFGYTPVANTETMSFTAWGAVDSSQDITVPATAYIRKDVTFALTGLAGADLIAFYIKHEGAHANDTLAVNTWLFGAWLEPT